MRLSRLALLTTVATALSGGCANPTDERAADFATIVTGILRPGCATAHCHDAMTAVEGLDFSTLATAGASIDRLVPIGGTPSPDETQLMNVLTTDGEERMPLDSPLPDADLELIRTWIVAGAVH